MFLRWLQLLSDGAKQGGNLFALHIRQINKNGPLDLLDLEQDKIEEFQLLRLHGAVVTMSWLDLIFHI